MPRPLNLSSGISPFARYGAGHYGARALSGLGQDEGPDVLTQAGYNALVQPVGPSGGSIDLSAGAIASEINPANIPVSWQLSNLFQGLPNNFFSNYGGLLLVGGGLVVFAVMSRKRR